MIVNDRYIIDFWGGSHGHFLEYVINCWLFDCDRTDQLFSHTGACHGANINKRYRDQRVIVCGHFSQFDIEISRSPEKTIRIVIDDFSSACCYQINVICRAGDIPKKDKELVDIPSSVRNDPVLLRNNYFTKLSDREHSFHLPGSWRCMDVPCLEINMVSLYDFFSLLQTLKQVSDFLEQKFTPDPELFHVWQEFMVRNQGWQSWTLCNELLKDTISNRDREINLEVEQQALLNVLLTRTVGIFDGDLFTRPHYPSNTKEIYELVKLHLDTFDSRF